MPLPYYRRLSRAQQALYRRSVALEIPKLRPDDELIARSAAVEVALLQESIARTRKAGQGLLDAICQQLEVPEVKVVVRARRPGDDESELHGLYEREEDEVAVITVWMRTSAKREVVKFRTFLRTLLHELVHHLDYDLYKLEDSLHTEGFFKRESALLRALVPNKASSRSQIAGRRPPKKKAPPRAPKPPVKARPRRAKARSKRGGEPSSSSGKQLSLFDSPEFEDGQQQDPSR
jgi:hypothetical protein